jgi:hypothetical protein
MTPCVALARGALLALSGLAMHGVRKEEFQLFRHGDRHDAGRSPAEIMELVISVTSHFIVPLVINDIK